jgi:hypothetical protein
MKANPYRRPGRGTAVRLVQHLTAAATHAARMHQAVQGHAVQTDFWLGARRAYIDAAKAAAIVLLRER